jgi:hypothetical protein
MEATGVGFVNLLRPRHRHRDPAVRRRAVEKLQDEDILLELACGDPDLEVRHRAVERLQSTEALRKTAIQGQHLDARLKAVARIIDPWILAEIMRERKNPDLMMACFEGIRDQEVLQAIAGDPAYNVTARRIAINMFADPQLLAGLLDSLRAPALRRAALRRLTGESAPPEALEERPHPEEHMDRILETYDAEDVVEMLGAFRDSPAAVRGLGVILTRGGGAGDRAAEILERLLKHATPEIRLEALRQLRPVVGRMSEVLQELAENDPDPRVRGAVRRTIQEQGDNRDT